VAGCVQCLIPIAGGNRSLKKEATQHVGGDNYIYMNNFFDESVRLSPAN
jgi:hypothetical protein